MEPTDVSLILADIEMTSRDLFETNNVQLTLSTSLPHIQCDRVRVTEVFRNLIANAIKYNDKELKQVEVDMIPRLACFMSGTMESHRGHVFRICLKLFKRLESSNDFSDGTGAGLTFVEKMFISMVARSGFSRSWVRVRHSSLLLMPRSLARIVQKRRPHECFSCCTTNSDC